MIDFKEIENQYNVESIKFNGIEAWPILRIYIASKLVLNKNRVKINKANIFLLTKSFFRGFHNILFFRNGYVAFSDTDRRVLIDGYYYDRLIDPLGEKLKLLVIETPLYTHYPKNKCKSKYLTSRLPFVLLEEIISFFIILKIENEYLLKHIISQTNTGIEYKKILKKVIAQSILMSLYIKVKKIKGVFLVVSYTKAGIIIACKKNNIPAVELQHGVINSSHYAYNINKKFSDVFFPDYILTYGNIEKDVLEADGNYFIKKGNIIPVGNYLIDFYRKTNFKLSEFEIKTKNFKLTIAVTGQTSFDKYLIPFILEVSLILKEVAFVYIPRGKNYFTENYYDIPHNILFINSLNTYDIIRRSSLHCTITSTCGLEALCMGIPNIFINIDGWSKKYYSFLESYPFNYFANSIDEFVNITKNIPLHTRNEVYSAYSGIIKDNYLNNLKDFLKKIKFV